MEVKFSTKVSWRREKYSCSDAFISIHFSTISYLISSVGRGGREWVISLLRRNKTGRERKDWSCAISGCSWGIYQRDPFRWRYSPGCTPRRQISADIQWGCSPLHPLFFFSSIFFSPPFFVLFGLITLIGTDTAMRTPGLIPAFTCLVDKSPANWDVTREGASPSSQELPSQ